MLKGEPISINQVKLFSPMEEVVTITVAIIIPEARRATPVQAVTRRYAEDAILPGNANTVTAQVGLTTIRVNVAYVTVRGAVLDAPGLVTYTDWQTSEPCFPSEEGFFN